MYDARASARYRLSKTSGFTLVLPIARHGTLFLSTECGHPSESEMLSCFSPLGHLVSIFACISACVLSISSVSWLTSQVHRFAGPQVYRFAGSQTGSASERDPFSVHVHVLVPPVFPSSTRHRPIAPSARLESRHERHSRLPYSPFPPSVPKSTYHALYIHISISRAQSPIRTAPAANPESAPTAGKYCKALSLCSVPARYSPPPRSSGLASFLDPERSEALRSCPSTPSTVTYLYLTAHPSASELGQHPPFAAAPVRPCGDCQSSRLRSTTVHDTLRQT
ncbi:hypothetical protein OH76DRAFT_817803 [Lentinus brumalis]|uniref:Uncharacterized protein n=1 Tax=Lentinus brumalis TaxID=2498619 RepID=A0A371D2J6_9APHY|nr:hypothetical protein OH76DRAFT_817803 [Polyporus brumalis]